MVPCLAFVVDIGLLLSSPCFNFLFVGGLSVRHLCAYAFGCRFGSAFFRCVRFSRRLRVVVTLAGRSTSGAIIREFYSLEFLDLDQYGHH